MKRQKTIPAFTTIPVPFAADAEGIKLIVFFKYEDDKLVSVSLRLMNDTLNNEMIPVTMEIHGTKMF